MVASQSALPVLVSGRSTTPARGRTALRDVGLRPADRDIEAGRSCAVLHVGNLDSRRDITDVRDVVRAYRSLVARGTPARPYNVCSGRGYRVGDLLDILSALARVRVQGRADPARLRPSDNPVILGDPTRIAARHRLGAGDPDRADAGGSPRLLAAPRPRVHGDGDRQHSESARGRPSTSRWAASRCCSAGCTWWQAVVLAGRRARVQPLRAARGSAAQLYRAGRSRRAASTACCSIRSRCCAADLSSRAASTLSRRRGEFWPPATAWRRSSARASAGRGGRGTATRPSPDRCLRGCAAASPARASPGGAALPSPVPDPLFSLARRWSRPHGRGARRNHPGPAGRQPLRRVDAGGVLWIGVVMLAVDRDRQLVPTAAGRDSDGRVGRTRSSHRRTSRRERCRLAGAIVGAIIGTSSSSSLGWPGWALLLLDLRCRVRHVAARPAPQDAAGHRRRARRTTGSGQRDREHRRRGDRGVARRHTPSSGCGPAGIRGGAGRRRQRHVASEIGKAWGRRTWLDHVVAPRAAGDVRARCRSRAPPPACIGALALGAVGVALGLIAGARDRARRRRAPRSARSSRAALGATLEGPGILNNDMLNFINTGGRRGARRARDACASMMPRAALYCSSSPSVHAGGAGARLRLRRRDRVRRGAARAVAPGLLLYPLIGVADGGGAERRQQRAQPDLRPRDRSDQQAEAAAAVGAPVDAARVVVHLRSPTWWRCVLAWLVAPGRPPRMLLARRGRRRSAPTSIRCRRCGPSAQGIWANVTIAIPRGVLLKVAGWSSVKTIVGLEPWYIGAIFGLFLLGASTTKDFADMEGDARGGCRTLPIIYGVERAAWMISPSFVVPFLMIAVGAWTGILTGNFILLQVLSLVMTVVRPLRLLSDAASAGGSRGRGEPRLVGAHVSDDVRRPGRLRARLPVLTDDGFAAFNPHPPSLSNPIAPDLRA